MKILVIEDDKFLREGLQQALEQESFACECAASLRQSWPLLNSTMYGLIILDLGLPDGDGMTLLGKLLRQGNSVPVLILTARDAIDGRVRRLDFGADDYLIKPFALSELLTRARAIIRRHQGVSNNLLWVDDISLDLTHHDVTVDGKAVILTPKEFAILSRLMLQAGHRIHRGILHLELHEKQHQINCQPLIERVDNMAFTVEQLLMLARIRNDFSSGQYQAVRLVRDVVLAQQDVLAEMAALREQRLDWQLSAADPVIQGNAVLLRLLLRNPVENTHRYCPDGSTITVTLRQDETPSGGQCILQVMDEGPGIDEARAVELTRQFVRMDQQYNGIGLGLSIVTRIAQLHHGCFTLSNRKDRGGTLARLELDG